MKDEQFGPLFDGEYQKTVTSVVLTGRQDTLRAIGVWRFLCAAFNGGFTVEIHESVFAYMLDEPVDLS